jgi:hypothetical protein
MVALLLSAAVSAFSQDEGYTYLEESEVRTALEETLSQPEFSRLRARPQEAEKESEMPEWLIRFSRWLGRLFGRGEEETDGGGFAFEVPGIGTALAILAAVLVAAAVVFLLRSALAARDKPISEEKPAGPRVFGPGTAPGELSPDEFWARAMEHARKRRYKEAVRELLLGAMSATERRGLIRFRRGLTNRDYLHAVRGPARESFRCIASTFEHVYFGRRDATPEAFREASQEYQKSFRGAAS